MSKHTQGPWEIVNGYYPGFQEIKGPSFKISVVLSASDLDFSDFQRRTSDMRLIAAAPDLLAVLQELCDMADDGDVVSWAAEWDKARAAITKATGESK
jgi:hypothetical protein